MIAVVKPTNSWSGITTRYDKLIIITNMVQWLRTADAKLIEIQTELTNIGMGLLDCQLTGSRPVVRLREIRIHEICAIFLCRLPASC